MPLAQAPKELPSINDVFGDNPRVVRMLDAAKVRSIATVMLLPREVLRDDARYFNGVGARTATYITGALAEHGLRHHTIFESLTGFVNREFNGIENTPIAALHVATLANDSTTRQVYAPVRLLHHLEEYEKHMVVGDLAKCDANDIRAMLSKNVQHGPIIELITENIRDINSRLAWWSADMRIAVGARQRRLRAVSE